MDSDWVGDQVRIYLIEPLRRYFAAQKRDAYVSGDSFVYFLDPKANKVRRLGPDFYVVLGGQNRGQTKWVAWEEGNRLPTTIIEFVSPSTEARDRGKKLALYRDVFKTEDYFLVKPDSLATEGLHLQRGHYLALKPNPEGRFWVESLGLFLGTQGKWVRFWTEQGKLLFTGSELAEQESQRAEQESQRAEQERRRAEQERQRAEQERQRAEQERQRAEQESQRAEQESQRAEQESQRAEQERQRAEQERQRAEQSEARVRELEEALRRMGNGTEA